MISIIPPSLLNILLTQFHLLIMSLSFVQTVLFLLFLTFHSLADDPSSGSAGTDTASFPTFPPADGFLGSSASISGLTTDGANNDQRGQVFDPLNDGEILASKIDACPDTQIPHSKRQNCRYIAPEGTNTPDTNGDEGGSNPVGKPSGEPDPLIPLQIPQLQDFKEDRSRCNHGLTKIPVCATSSNAIYSTPLYQGTSFFNLPTCHLCT